VSDDDRDVEIRTRAHEVLTFLIYDAMQSRLTPEERSRYGALVAAGEPELAAALVREGHRFDTVAEGNEVLLYDLGELVARIPMPNPLGLCRSSGDPFGDDA
jgi:hypothetical protein